MKKFYAIIFVCALMCGSAFAQEGTAAAEAAAEAETGAAWKMGGYGQSTFNQVALVNWAAGGDPTIALSFNGGFFAKMKKGKHNWDNTYDGVWGVLRTADKDFRKSEDRMELNSIYGYEVAPKWYLSSLFNAKTQFAKGYKYNDDDSRRIVSKFGAPAWLLLGVGMDYKPNDWFHIYMSPATGRVTFVRTDPEIDETLYGLTAGDVFRGEFGAYMSTSLEYEIFKNVSVKTKLDVFNNYTDPNKPNRRNFDVDWNTAISMKVNKYLSASLQWQLLYDHDIDVPLDRNDDGVFESTGKRTQFRESFGVALSYKFGQQEE